MTRLSFIFLYAVSGNRLRETFGFEGTPIRLVLRGKKEMTENDGRISIYVAGICSRVHPKWPYHRQGIFHTDIRKEGSHNTGATNAYRLLGKAGGLAVLICDMLKGFWRIHGATCGSAARSRAVGTFDDCWWPLGYLGPFMLDFMKFKGGKGVATGLGVILFLVPVETAIVFAVWCVIVALTRIVSLGSIVAAILVPVTMFLFHEPIEVIILVFSQPLSSLFAIKRILDASCRGRN